MHAATETTDRVRRLPRRASRCPVLADDANRDRRQSCRTALGARADRRTRSWCSTVAITVRSKTRWYNWPTNESSTRARPDRTQRGRLRRHARVVEFNDLAALERDLPTVMSPVVLAEPVMTNAGMVLPEDGFWARARELCDRHGVLLIVDETHTLSSGPGGHARRIGLKPDLLVVGKAIAGGVPCAVYGFTAALAQRMSQLLATKPPGHSGMGTTLAANPLATAALTACLEHVMTNDAFAHMNRLADLLCTGLTQTIRRHALPWHVVSVGARSELCFSATAARTARESLDAAVPEGTGARIAPVPAESRRTDFGPFHNMMLMTPSTTDRQVQALLHAIDACCNELKNAA